MTYGRVTPRARQGTVGVSTENRLARRRGRMDQPARPSGCGYGRGSYSRRGNSDICD